MKKILLIVLAVFGLLSGVFYLVAEYGFETLFSDAATRLAYQIRDEAAELRHSGESTRTFVHKPWAWPDGITGDYRIEIIEYKTAPRPGHRSIGVARSLAGPAWYTTSYELNFVEVPRDLSVAHQKGEPTLVTLQMQDGKVLLTDLK